MVLITGLCVIFQSALPRGERPVKIPSSPSHWYFNPRSHEGSDEKKRDPEWYKAISIRAPTRGATWYGRKHADRNDISIRAPTRGATAAGLETLLPFIFQSALPRGERLGWFTLAMLLVNISIRAPTRGATGNESSGKK